MIKAAVIGDPISHSLSPKIHGYFLRKYNIDGSYEAIRVEKNNLKEDVLKLINEGYAGFNVTLPHKEEIFKLCYFRSKSAEMCGAVNTVIITEDKKLFGHNSDVDGFLNNLKISVPDFDLKGKNAFVIGAGGAARAVVYGLLKSGVKKVFITNRNFERAEKLITDFAKMGSVEFLAHDDFCKKLDVCDLLVNSTSLGMKGQEPLKINLENLQKSAIVYDIVYKPLITELLASSQKRGNKIVTGIGMLTGQALIGFEAWFKTKPEADVELEKILTQNL